MQVLMGDASVKVVSPNVQPTTWWRAITPAEGLSIPSDW
jgi:hypothetical protein